ncbi:calcium-activated chloride channel regulator 1-like [Dermacentor albipictus]|uniref:calcium-activated chloride channel regulator 1-like n=1 Tax=Dermacentor albipictus TaxID=60249 RepID=UPI0038FC5645
MTTVVCPGPLGQRDPPIFSGTEDHDLEDWLADYDRMSIHNLWDDTKKTELQYVAPLKAAEEPLRLRPSRRVATVFQAVHRALLQSSSEFLHEATGGRVFLKQVVIEFPETWPERSTARSVPKFAFSTSDVRVEAFESVRKGHFFSTKLRGRCGKRGDFIRISPHVLAEVNATKKALSDATYAFVNEWARFRYGVFYEYGRLGHKTYPMSYCPCCNKEVVRWNSCSDRIQHRILNEDMCAFHDHCYATEDCVVVATQPEHDPVKSSIMYLPRLENIKDFCNSEDKSHRHNKFAPNMHNKMCNGKPTWDVIKQNEDFMGLPPANMSKPVVVEFDEIQMKPRTSLRAVLVLDLSKSMKAHKRLETLKDFLDDFLPTLLDDFVQLAIVTFSRVAKVLHPMMAVNHQTVEGFRDAVKNMSAVARTCIGCGLQRALEVLNTSSETPEGAMIVLLTDGMENEFPSIDDVWPQLLASKVQVVTMAMGENAQDRLEELAAETKGQSYFFPDPLENALTTYIESANSEAHERTYHQSVLITPNETAKCNTSESVVDGEGTTGTYHREFASQIAAAKAGAEILQSANDECFQGERYYPALILKSIFVKTLYPDSELSSEPILVMYESKGFTGTIQETFLLDDALGNNTIVNISRQSTRGYSLTAWLVDPTGKRCQNCQEVESGRDKSLTIPSPATPGTWTLQVESSSKGRVVVNIHVVSQIKDLGNTPIVALCQMSQTVFSQPEDAVIFVDVMKGSNVVLEANVTAVVHHTQQLSCPVRLHDDGEDPDIMAQDGTYSGYFTQFTGQGRYSVHAYIYGDNKTRHAYRRPGFPPDAIALPPEDSPAPPNPTWQTEIKRAPDNYTFVDTLLGEQEPTAPFQRFTLGAYFKLTSNLQQKDVPPGIIWDLRAVSGYVEIDRTPVVCLTWTWPGAHMTQGKAAGVEIRGGTDEDYLQSHFDSHEVMSDVRKGNLQALPPGSRHEVTIALPRNWVTSAEGVDYRLEAYLAARVINAEGLKSKLSSTVRVPFQISNFTAFLIEGGPGTTTRTTRQHTNPVPARTATETPYEDKDAATTTTPAKVEPGIDPATTTTAGVGHPSENDKPSVITWILLALVAGFVVVFIAVMLLYRARESTTTEDQGLSTNTQTATTM